MHITSSSCVNNFESKFYVQYMLCLTGFVAAGEDDKILDKEAIFCRSGLRQWAAGLHPDQ